MFKKLASSLLIFSKIYIQSINLNENSKSWNCKGQIKEDDNFIEEYDSNKTKKERFGRKQDKGKYQN